MRYLFAAVSILACAACLGAVPAADEVRIGIIESMFGEKDPKAIEVEVIEFRRLMDAATKLKGSSTKVKDVRQLGEQLVNKKLDLGVCHGFEMAWIKAQFPQVKFLPLVVAINEQPTVKSVIVVKADSPIQKFDELQGKTLAYSKSSKAFSRLFLERLCGKPIDAFFSKVVNQFTGRDRKTRDMNSEVALDQVVEGSAQATVVDSIALKQYERRKPERFRMLRVLESSVDFPATAVFYVDGAVDQATLKKCQDALLNFHRSSGEAKNLLELWRLTQFTTVPADYDAQLSAVLKAYTPPT
jgi:ABC-type phosphate/phosphonate transport system substrate-binding protein